MIRTYDISVEGIPVILIQPEEAAKGTVIFYHGWSSSAEMQKTRAVILAAHGYSVLLPDAVHHGKRGTIEYYEPESYDVFWNTILQNVREFPLLHKEAQKAGFEKPWIMGHSMGGLTVMGIAAAYGRGIKGCVSLNGSGDWLLTHLFLQARFGCDLGKSWKMYDTVAAAEPMAHINEMCQVPILMLNGEIDPSIDHRAQKHFFDTVKEENSRAAMTVYPGLGHFVTTNMMDDALTWMAETEAKEQ